MAESTQELQGIACSKSMDNMCITDYILFFIAVWWGKVNSTSREQTFVIYSVF